MDITAIIETVTGDLAGKKRWNAYRGRVKALPTPYRDAVAAIERYLLNVGGIANGTVLVRMVEDLADLFERAAADVTPIRDVVGEDPVEFAEAFLANYADAAWTKKERTRLVERITKAEAAQ